MSTQAAAILTGAPCHACLVGDHDRCKGYTPACPPWAVELVTCTCRVPHPIPRPRPVRRDRERALRAVVRAELEAAPAEDVAVMAARITEAILGHLATEPGPR